MPDSISTDALDALTTDVGDALNLMSRYAADDVHAARDRRDGGNLRRVLCVFELGGALE